MTQIEHIGHPDQLPPVRKQSTQFDFYTNLDDRKKHGHMTYYAARTKTHAFTIWFQWGRIEYNLRPILLTRYSYTSEYPLPIHYAIIKHFDLKAEIKEWNESYK